MASRTKFKNLTSSAVVAAGDCILEGMYVNSTSSGEIHIYHSATGTTETQVWPIAGTMTPAAGYHYLGNLHATAGVYVGVQAGTINVTFFTRESD
jgi:hypothetical protein